MTTDGRLMQRSQRLWGRTGKEIGNKALKELLEFRPLPGMLGLRQGIKGRCQGGAEHTSWPIAFRGLQLP